MSLAFYQNAFRPTDNASALPGTNKCCSKQDRQQSKNVHFSKLAVPLC